MKLTRVLYSIGETSVKAARGWVTLTDTKLDDTLGWTRSYMGIEDLGEYIVVVVPRGLPKHPDGTDVIRYLEDLGITVFVRKDKVLSKKELVELVESDLVKPIPKDRHLEGLTDAQLAFLQAIPRNPSNNEDRTRVISVFSSRLPGDLIAPLPANIRKLRQLHASADSEHNSSRYAVLVSTLQTLARGKRPPKFAQKLLDESRGLTILEFELDAWWAKIALERLRNEAERLPRVYEARLYSDGAEAL
ncbi:MAG: hypothetical protein HRT62_10790 [Epibacterium sp.]|nr:hypothetical protein [Epibacterium sp.]